MAGADYRSCDICGSKTFYDADLQYDKVDASHPAVRGEGYNLGYLGDWKVICHKCAETNEVVIQPIRRRKP